MLTSPSTNPNSCPDDHRCFRLLLQAMSRPGTIFSLPQEAAADFNSQLIRLLATILDQQVGFYLIDPDAVLEQLLENRTGARAVAAEEADFLLAPQGNSRGRLAVARRGEIDFPDQGATILYGVDKLRPEAADGGIRLTGPGIENAVYLGVDGLPAEELKQLKEVNAEFPLGIDAIFLDRSGGLACIPRTTRTGGY